MIKIIVTGGTIDDLEYNSEDKAPKFKESLIPSQLEQARITSKYKVEVLMQKDSKFLREREGNNSPESERFFGRKNCYYSWHYDNAANGKIPKQRKNQENNSVHRSCHPCQ